MSTTTANPLTCFDGLIDLRGMCSDNTPHTRLWINDVGISKNELDELATEDYVDGYDLFIKKRTASIDEVTNYIHTALQPKYRARSVIENMRVGFFQDNLNQIAGLANTLRLLQFELLNQSSYVDLFVSELSLQVDYTGNVTINVFDLITGKNIDNIVVPCVANEISTVFPNKKYKSSRRKLNLIFAYESAGINSNTTWILRDGNCSGCTGRMHYQNQYMRITGGKMASDAQKIDKNVVQTTDTGGISIVYSLSCNHTDWLCSVNNTIALPILYKTAAAIMEHGVYISPLEQMTPRTQSSHILFARLNAYMAKYKESLENVLKEMSVPTDEKCFTCNNRISTHSAIPA